MPEIPPTNDQIKKLLEENLAYSKEIYQLEKKVKNYILWGRIMSLISLLLVVVPLIVGYIYLPTILDNAINRFVPADLREALNLGSMLNGGLNEESIIDTLQQQAGNPDPYQQILNSYK